MEKTTAPNWFYENFNRQMLYMQFFEEPEFCEALAYLLTFQKHTDLKVIPHAFSIEITNAEVHIFVIHTVFFQQKEYENAKRLKNVHFVAFGQELIEMHEFKEMKNEIKFISKAMLMATVEALTNNKLVQSIQRFKELSV